MARTKRTFCGPYPDDHQIYVNRVCVKRVHLQKFSERILEMQQQEAPYLKLVAEPENPDDENAIQVVACYKGTVGESQLHIGYLDSTLAAHITAKDALPILFPRLRQIRTGNSVAVEMDLTGPKGGKAEFQKAIWRPARRQPATVDLSGKVVGRCGTCKAKLAVSDEYAGKRIKCPKCKSVVQLPLKT